MRNNKKRREDAINLIKAGKKLLDQQMKSNPDRVDKSLWPDEIFENNQVKCPKCGCEYTFEYGGGVVEGVEVKIYVCKSCRVEFDIYPE